MTRSACLQAHRGHRRLGSNIAKATAAAEILQQKKNDLSRQFEPKKEEESSEHIQQNGMQYGASCDALYALCKYPCDKDW